MVEEQHVRYQSYLLRIWREGEDESQQTVYRLSLEHARTHKRHGFSTVEQVCAFLAAQIEAGKRHQGELEP